MQTARLNRTKLNLCMLDLTLFVLLFAVSTDGCHVGVRTGTGGVTMAALEFVTMNVS